MKKVLLLRNISRGTTAETDLSDFFTRATRGIGELYETTFEDLIIRVGDGTFTIFDTKNQLDLKKFRTIFIRGLEHFDEVRDVALAIRYYGKRHHIKVVNSIEYDTSSKLAHAVRFHSQKVPVAKTIWLSRAVLDDETVASELGFPCIMKATVSYCGKYNYLVNSYAEIVQHQTEHPDKFFVLQRKVGGAGDYRLLMIGKEKLLISYPVQTDKDYQAQASSGDGSRACDINVLPKQAIRDAEKMAKYLNMEISGSDILVDKQSGEYHFLEINAQPALVAKDDPVAPKIKLTRKYIFDIFHRAC